MLNINKTIEYALIAIRHINNNSKNKLCTSREIANIYNIPQEILAKTLQKLCKKGYLLSRKGINGGYALNKNLETINLIDFIESIEGPIGVVQCSNDIDCEIVDNCNIKNPMNQINKNIRRTLSELNLYELTI
jgi:Rrf2 family protein